MKIDECVCVSVCKCRGGMGVYYGVTHSPARWSRTFAIEHEFAKRAKNDSKLMALSPPLGKPNNVVLDKFSFC